jgi:transcriptional regulator with XRE-family HTH domain
VLHLRQNKEKWIKNLMQKNGLKIKEIMQEKSIFVTQMSKKLGVTRQSLYRCLNGNPTMNRLKEIADILDVSPKDLFGDEKKD